MGESATRGGRDDPNNLESLLDEMRAAAESSDGPVTVGELLDQIGRRSFGPLLVLPALIAFTPLGGIPLLPSLMAMMVVVISAQMLVGMEHFWMPKVVLRRSVEPDRLCKSSDFLRRPASVADKMIRPRLTRLTKEPFVHLAALICILVAFTVPPLEIVPFAGTVSWIAIGLFGLALIAHDGLLALTAFAFALGAGWTVYQTVL